MEEKILMEGKCKNVWSHAFIPLALILTAAFILLIYILEGQFFIEWLWESPMGIVWLALILIAVIVSIIIGNCEISVTNMRVSGKAVFKTRVDLPIDSISAVGLSWLNGISISSASGHISFLLISNHDEIHKCISDLLLERQSKPMPATTIKQEVSQSNADELKKFKELLDAGIITQDEFDAKKKQLLGL